MVRMIHTGKYVRYVWVIDVVFDITTHHPLIQEWEYYIHDWIIEVI